MNSSVFVAVASAALFVLVFQGGEAAAVETENVLSSKTSLEPDVVTANSDTKWLEYNTSRIIGGKISCVLTLKRGDYFIVPDVGAYKIHTRPHQCTWYHARKICSAEGGQLAVMDTQQKHDLFLKWKRERDDTRFWLGFHNLFEEDMGHGSWVTMTGESIDSIGYYPWAKNEPSDKVNRNCAYLRDDGMANWSCNGTSNGFICEINLCETLGHRVHDFKHDSTGKAYVFYE